MIHELRKIWKDRRLVLLLVLVILVNAVVFFTHCVDDTQGCSMIQIKEIYQHSQTLSEEQKALEERYLEYLYTDPGNHALTALSVQIERNQEVLDRIEQAQNYQQYRAQLIAEAELKLKLGLFGDPECFAARALSLGIDKYAALEKVEADAVFLGGFEVLLAYHTTDWLLLIFVFMGGLILLTYEKGAGLLKMIQLTQLGHSRLFLRKFAAAVTLMTIGFLFLYGSNFLIVGILFGFENISCSIQSLYGFANCPLMLSIGAVLAQAFILKYIWAFACLSLVFFVCTGTRAAALAIAEMTVCGIAAYWMGTSQSLWLRNMSLMQLACAENLYQEAIYLNFFNTPVGRIPVAVVWMLLLSGVSLGGGLFCFCGAKHTNRRRHEMPVANFYLKHTNLFLHEWNKTFVMWKGGWILLVFLAVQLICYWNYPVNNSEFETYYRSYSEILSGQPNVEKDAYLQQEQARFDDLNQQLAEFAAQYPDLESFQRMTQDIRSALRPQDAFFQAKSQYLNLRTGQSYLYQTGYSKLLGTESIQEDIADIGKTFFIMALLLSTIFSEEKECGVQILQTSSRRSNTVFRSKIGTFLICAFVTAIIAFLPNFIAVFWAYGGLDWLAQANSISYVSFLPDIWSVGGLFTVILIGKILLTSAAGGIVCWISYRTPNTVTTLILAFVILLLPTLILFFVFR